MTTPTARRLAATAAVLLAAPLGAQQPAANGTRGLDRANMDTTCAACQDFYTYANGGWLARATIPAAYSTYGTFTELADRNQEVLRQVLDEAARNAATAKDVNARKVGLFYASCMDTTAVEAAGVRPLASRLADIDAIKSLADLQREAARLQMNDVGVLFSIGSEPDLKRASEVILGVGQGGLGLPDRDYYTKSDSASARIRAQYVDHVARTLQLLGEPAAQAASEARRIMDIETAMAKASMTRVERRDPNAQYHKMTVADFDRAYPKVGLPVVLKAMGAPTVPAVNVAQPVFFTALDSLLGNVPLADWKSYLKWQLASTASPALSSAFVNESFRFDQVMSGAKELLPRWKRCIQAADRYMGEAVGQAYVERTFSPEAKARALAMVKNLESVLREHIQALTWMSDSTKKQALVKLDAFVNKVGYPDRWRDYSPARIERQPYALNRFAAAEFESRRDLNKIGKPLDRTEWGFTVPTVNASYSALRNEVTFPAGILQPPFFDPSADDAVNYGGMGAAIGHEMTHGFDDEGRQFDAAGNLRDWWTPADAQNYQERAKLVEEQFDGYVGVDTLHVNGKLTLGENIADLGGLKIAYDAFEKAQQGKARTLIDGETPEQRFFLAWAQVWRRSTRPERARQLLIIDPHSPSKWRVNGPLSNMPEFAKAFGCQAGDPMVRPEQLRAQIW